MEIKKILIWGEAGVGKTTFCAKFCQDWALVVKEKEGKGQELTEEQKFELDKLTEEQKCKLNNIGLLIYIVLRNIDEGANTINDIVTSQLGFSQKGSFMSQPGLREQLTNVLGNVIENRHLLLLFDGFDEMPEKKEVIKCVTNNDSYQNLQCITTCRPHASHGILLKVDEEIRLKGFSYTQTKAFVEMYARIKYTEQSQIISYVSQTMSQIESSAELLEMSTNPSMLQLLCFLSWKQDKIGKDRTSLFKDYTRYLLMQYHIKLGIKEKLFSDDLYKQHLLNSGKVALMGLKENQLQLVFSKSIAHQIGGDEIFDIGFLTELPCTETDDTHTDTKVQFTHKTLQEYLAAYYVVNTPGSKGLKLVMEFCCTSKRLMGSQIILEFVSNMSRKMGKEIQKKIRDYVSKWDSDDKLDEKSRTSFLILMLKGNKNLTFPLPAVVDIDLREYDIVPGFFTKFFNIFIRSKSALERFFDMDGKGVKNIKFIPGEYNRLNVLTNTSMDSAKELTINYWKSWSKQDNEDLREVMEKTKPGLLSIRNCKKMLMDKATIDVVSLYVHNLILEKCDLDNDNGNQVTDKSACITLIHKAATMKSLSICNCGIQIDTEIAEAVSMLPDHSKLDLSGNQVTDKSVCITLIQKAAFMKSLNIHDCMSNCGIKIDKDIAEAVSRLPDHAQLDLSANQITDKSVCITLIHKAATMKSLNIHDCMSNCGIQIDTKIAEAVSRLPDHTQLDLSGNQITDKSVCITLIHKAATMKSLNIHDCMSNCGIKIDTKIAEAVSRLPDHTQLDLSGNGITKMKPYLLSRILLYMTKQEKIDIDGWGITVDEDIVRALSKLSKLQTLIINYNFSNNKLTPRASSELPQTVSSMSHLQVLFLDRCNISNDVIVALTDSLYKHCPLLEELSLRYNHLSSDVWEEVKHIQKMKNLRWLWYWNPCMWDDKHSDEIITILDRFNPGLGLSKEGLTCIIESADEESEGCDKNNITQI